MKLNIFQSNKGDCILLESSDGKRILCDGGMGNSMRDNVRKHLAKLRTNGHELDYVYVSHVDNDHISGVLQLFRDELEWRVYDHHKKKTKKPSAPRPPKIGGIWHNAFRDQVPDNKGDIEKLLAAAAPVFFGTGVPDLMRVGNEMQSVALGVPEALEVSKLADRKLLGIPTNKLPGVKGQPKLLMRRANQKHIDVGSLKLTIIGPSADELEDLRKGWDNWIRDHGEEVKKIRAQMKSRLDSLGNGAATAAPFNLRDWNGIPDYKNVTIPNIASLMFMVEENKKRLLLTGDGQQEFILKGLEETGFLANGSIHIDVLKVQHHGSENNIDADFCRKVSADHYVFCGNGMHENPDLSRLKIIYASRLGPANKLARAPEAAGKDFHFWFSSKSANLDPGSTAYKNFVEVEKTVAELKAKSHGRLKTHYNPGDVHVLSV